MAHRLCKYQQCTCCTECNHRSSSNRVSRAACSWQRRATQGMQAQRRRRGQRASWRGKPLRRTDRQVKECREMEDWARETEEGDGCSRRVRRAFIAGAETGGTLGGRPLPCVRSTGPINKNGLTHASTPAIGTRQIVYQRLSFIDK